MRKFSELPIWNTLARHWLQVSLAALFLLAAALRLVNLTNPPLDYFPQRQLRGAIIARSLYYQMLPSADPSMRQQAEFLEHTMDVREPSIFESLVAVTYLPLGGEQLWVARVYAILFWLLGGAALYALGRRLTSPMAALAPLIYFFFLPWSVIFSRIFQPDILMLMLVLWAAYTLQRWGDTPTWKWALLTGLLAGLASLVKLPAILPLALMIGGIVFTRMGFRQAVSNRQVWVMSLLMVVFPGIYYLFVIPGDSRGWLEFTLTLIDSWFSPSFYIRWIIFAGGLVDLGIAFVSFIGVWLLPRRDRVIPLALWLGYVLQGLAFPYHILTHEYYSIPLLPAVALSLAPLAQLVFNHARQYDRGVKLILAGILVFAIGYSSWISRSILLGSDYRSEVTSWTNLGRALPQQGNLIGITHEQGYRIAYYGWRHVDPWNYDAAFEQSLTGSPDAAEEFRTTFETATEGREYFVVTLFSQFDSLPILKSYLYDRFPIYAEGDGYLIFDLRGGSTP